MSWFNKLEELHNYASDLDFVWFPFNCLKPQVTEKIIFSRNVVMTISFGAYYGIFYCIKRVLFNALAFFKFIFTDIITATIIFFFWFNLVTVPLWNRRAKKFIESRKES